MLFIGFGMHREILKKIETRAVTMSRLMATSLRMLKSFGQNPERSLFNKQF